MRAKVTKESDMSTKKLSSKSCKNDAIGIKTVQKYFKMTPLVKITKKTRPIEHQLKIFLFEFEFHNLLLVSGATLTGSLLSSFCSFYTIHDPFFCIKQAKLRETPIFIASDYPNFINRIENLQNLHFRRPEY